MNEYRGKGLSPEEANHAAVMQMSQRSTEPLRRDYAQIDDGVVWHRVSDHRDADDTCVIRCTGVRVMPLRTALHIPPKHLCADCQQTKETKPMNDNLPAIAGEIMHEVAVARPPEIVLDEARKAATALKTVLDQKPNKVMFNNEQYLEAEDWILLGRFYGITGKIVATTFVEFGTVQGFEARAVAVRADGMEISAAEAMCLNDEEKWRARPKYAWCYVTKSGEKVVDDPGPDQIVWEPNPQKPGKKRPKKERTLMGEESVPLFQLRSMAQTRAMAKVLSNVLRWVPVLAGYKGTPAEEMSGAEPQAREPEVIQREADGITKAQAKVLVQRAKAAGHDLPELMEWLGVETLGEVKQADFDAILARVDNVTPLSEPVEGMKREEEIPFEEPGSETAAVEVEA